MLHGMGFPDLQIPSFLVHGWWNIGGAKISKSLGNTVDPNVLVERYGAAALRYYLMADIVTGKDSDFSEERLRGRYNDELANNVGNLLNRTLNMSARYKGSVLRNVAVDHELLHSLAVTEFPQAVAAYSAAMGDYQVDAALRAVIGLARFCNQVIESIAPWKLAKDTAQSDLLDAVLYHLAESIRVVAILLEPVLPDAARGIFRQLQINSEPQLADAVWGVLLDGHILGAPTPLFPRLEAPAEVG